MQRERRDVCLQRCVCVCKKGSDINIREKEMPAAAWYRHDAVSLTGSCLDINSLLKHGATGFSVCLKARCHLFLGPWRVTWGYGSSEMGYQWCEINRWEQALEINKIQHNTAYWLMDDPDLAASELTGCHIESHRAAVCAWCCCMLTILLFWRYINKIELNWIIPCGQHHISTWAREWSCLADALFGL